MRSVDRRIEPTVLDEWQAGEQADRRRDGLVATLDVLLRQARRLNLTEHTAVALMHEHILQVCRRQDMIESHRGARTASAGAILLHNGPSWA